MKTIVCIFSLALALSGVAAKAAGPRSFTVCAGTCPVYCTSTNRDTGAEENWTSWDPRCQVDAQGHHYLEVGAPRTVGYRDVAIGGEGLVGGDGGDGSSAVHGEPDEAGAKFAARSYYLIGTAAAVLSALASDGGTLAVGRAESKKVEQLQADLTARIARLNQAGAATEEELSRIAGGNTAASAGLRDSMTTLRTRLGNLETATSEEVAAAAANLAASDPFRADFAGQYFRLLGGSVLQPVLEAHLSTYPPTELLPSFLQTPAGMEPGLVGWLNWESRASMPGDSPPVALSAHAAAIAGAQHFVDQARPAAMPIAEALLGEAISIRNAASQGGGRAILLCDSGGPSGLVSRPWMIGTPMPEGGVARSLPGLLERQSLLEDEVARRLEANASANGDWSRVSLRGLVDLLASARWNLQEGRVVAAGDAQAIVEELLDYTTRLTPVVAELRDIFESVTGVDAITGRTLSDDERAAAVWSVVTLGVGDAIRASSRWIVEGTEFGKAARRRIQAVREVLGQKLSEIKPTSRTVTREIDRMARRINVSREELLLHFEVEGTMYREARAGYPENLNILIRDPRSRDYLRMTTNAAGDALISAREVRANSVRNRVARGDWIPVLK